MHARSGFRLPWHLSLAQCLCDNGPRRCAEPETGFCRGAVGLEPEQNSHVKMANQPLQNSEIIQEQMNNKNIQWNWPLSNNRDVSAPQ